MKAWSQAPCTKQWLQCEASPQTDSDQKSAFQCAVWPFARAESSAHDVQFKEAGGGDRQTRSGDGREKAGKSGEGNEPIGISGECGWYRYRSQGDLRGRPTGPGRQSGAQLRDVHRRSERDGGMAGELWRYYGGDGIHRSVLDSGG